MANNQKKQTNKTGSGTSKDDATQKPKQTFGRMLEENKAQIIKALPAHIDLDWMMRVTLSLVKSTPAIMQCTVESVFACAVQSAQLGLAPGINGEAYFVPYNNKKGNVWVKECQLIPGYRGLIKLARNSSQIKSVTTRVVCSKDEFDLILGTTDEIKHKPCMDDDPGKPVLIYCRADFVNGGHHLEYMRWSEIMKIKARTKSKNKEGEITGPWVTDEMEMAKKTVVRRSAKYWPMSPVLHTAIQLDTAGAIGVNQQLDHKAILNGTHYTLPNNAALEDNSNENQAGVSGAAAIAGNLQEKQAVVGKVAPKEQSNKKASVKGNSGKTQQVIDEDEARSYREAFGENG